MSVFGTSLWMMLEGVVAWGSACMRSFQACAITSHSGIIEHVWLGWGSCLERMHVYENGLCCFGREWVGGGGVQLAA